MNKLKIITHNGAFHADDVCAVATLDILYKGNIEVIRTRDLEIIKTGSIILDVGGKNDGEKYFDHHQEGGAGIRENGIPYASFGLIWKRFGKELIGSDILAEKFDKVFIQAVDALDNGVAVVDSRFNDVFPWSFNSMVMSFNPTWKEEDGPRMNYFLDAVKVFKHLIEKAIDFLKSEEEAKSHVLEDYKNAPDKRIVILQHHYPFQEVLSDLPEPLFAIYPSPENATWHVKAISSGKEAFRNRIQFPSTWAGKMNEELAEITGVSDALFCHNKLFLVTAKTQEGALLLAKKALE